MSGTVAIERALSILACFDGDQGKLSLSELATKADLPPSSLLRILEPLLNSGYLRRAGSSDYALGGTFLRMANRYRRFLRIAEVAAPVLEFLTKTTTESSAVFIRQGDKRLCVAKQEGQHPVREHMQEGDTLPLGSGGAGRIILAFEGEAGAAYDAIRRDGYLLSEGHRNPDMASISSPVFDGSDAPCFGAVTVIIPRYRMTKAWTTSTIDAVMSAGTTLSQRLGGAPERSVFPARR